MKVAIVRGAYLNKYEMQSYEPLIGNFDLVGFSSLRPIDSDLKFPVIKLSSPMDLPNFPYKMPILNRIFGDAHVLFGLEKKLKGFDIAHCAETYFYFTQQCLNAKKKGFVKKVIATVWENIPFNNEGIRKRKEFKKRAIRETDYFICVTNQAKKALIKEGCDENKISVVYPGIDLNKFQIINKGGSVSAGEFPNKHKQIKILFVGRLVKEKGILDLLEVFNFLKREFREIKLIIVGDGKEKKEIEAKVREWGIEKSVSLRKVNYENIPGVYQEADIFVLPSKKTRYWQEQFGMVLVEAMASGLPVIATDSGAISEVLGDVGILVKEGDILKLTKILKSLIENRDLRNNLGIKGRKRVEVFFDARKQAEKIGKIYANISGFTIYQQVEVKKRI